jgi:C-terminal processing protease CtpA/Prc
MSLPKTSTRIAFAMCSLLACVGSAALTARAAEAAEAGQKTESAARDEAERQRKLNDARKRLDEAAREVAELSSSMAEEWAGPAMRIMGRHASRAMLGINIGGGRRDERKDGVEILSVSPGGPAADAVLKAGDVIVAINDKTLQQDGAKTSREQLLAAMREVEPEEKVKVRYLRGGKTATATVVASRTDTMFSMPMPIQGLEHLPSLALMRSQNVFGSAELVTLTPKLGQYFGADKGLLVVRAPADSRLQLEEGDVLLDIDGRVPTNASHALRILGSYQGGEKLKLNVVRMKKRMTFEVTVPEDVREGPTFQPPDNVFFRAAPAPALPPAPPVPGEDTA